MTKIIERERPAWLTAENEAELGAFEKWLNPPENLRGLHHVIGGLRLLSGELNSLVERFSDDFKFTTSEVVQSWFTLVHKLEPFGAWDKTSTEIGAVAPFARMIGKHPLYVMIGELDRVQPDIKVLHIIALMLLITHELAERKIRNTWSASVSVFNAVRLIAVNAEDVFKYFPFEKKTINDYYDVFCELFASREERGFRPVEITRLNQIKLVLQYFVTRVGGRRRGGRIVVQSKLRTSGLLLDIQQVSNVNSNLLNYSRKSGLALIELSEPFEFVSVNTDPDPECDIHDKGEVSLAQQVLERRNLIAMISRSNQLIPQDWNYLSDAEVALLLHGIRVELKKSLQGHDCLYGRAVLRGEACIALYFMLWAALDVSQLMRLRIYVSVEKLPKKFPEDGAAYLEDEKLIVLPVIRPNGRPAYKGSEFDLAHSVGDRIFLKIGPLIHPLIYMLPRVNKWSNSETESASSEMFASTYEELSKAINQLLSELSKQTGGHFTKARIRNVLPRRLYHRIGDLAQVALGLNYRHPLADTALHYLSVDAKVVTAQVQVTADELRQSVIAELDAAQIQTNKVVLHTQAANENTLVGSPIDPLPETIWQVRISFQQLVKDARKNVLTDDYRIMLHNAFASYVHCMLRFATGVRDVGEPLPRWNRINLTRQLIILSDKDDASSYSSRVLPLATMLVQQLEYWRIYIDLLGPQLRVHGVGVEEYASMSAPIIFYLKRKKSGLEVVNSQNAKIRESIESHLNWFKLPWNCNRHYLRSCLVERGCKSEYIDAFMGHWNHGREPWGAYSALPAAQIISELRPHLDAVLESAGFLAIEGWLG